MTAVQATTLTAFLHTCLLLSGMRHPIPGCVPLQPSLLCFVNRRAIVCSNRPISALRIPIRRLIPNRLSLHRQHLNPNRVYEREKMAKSHSSSTQCNSGNVPVLERENNWLRRYRATRRKEALHSSRVPLFLSGRQWHSRSFLNEAQQPFSLEPSCESDIRPVKYARHNWLLSPVIQPLMRAIQPFAYVRAKLLRSRREL